MSSRWKDKGSKDPTYNFRVQMSRQVRVLNDTLLDLRDAASMLDLDRCIFCLNDIKRLSDDALVIVREFTIRKT